MNTPAPYNFENSYRGDAMQLNNIVLAYDSGVPVDLTGAVVKMQLRRALVGKVVWEFSSIPGKDSLLSVDPLNGGILFPVIPAWEIPAGLYFYDLQVKHPDLTVRTYIRGTWLIVNDVTKIGNG